MTASSARSLLRDDYGPADIRQLEAALEERGTLTFVRLDSGLFSAAAIQGGDRTSGYQNVWSRDNVFVGWAHVALGDRRGATDVARALLAFYSKHEHRFRDIIAGVVDPDNVAQRPHVRFDGEALAEIGSQQWSHAQNDALGYVLWFCSNLALRRWLDPTPQEWDTLALVARYFAAIRYWEDRDSGHWEEARKVSASSIGVVTAGLTAWCDLLRQRRPDAPPSAGRAAVLDGAQDLVARGERALGQILPAECAQTSPQQNRRYDAALLFLAYPLQVLSGTMARQIVDDCERFLRGAVGFRRYLGDSYWAPDYDAKLAPQDRTRDFSEDMAFRDALLPSIGQEAQWCLFDSILSAYFGRRYLAERNQRDRERQIEYLNRALCQVTGETFDPPWRCPELYFLKNGAYTPNPHTPLQWAQANLIVALRSMRASADAALE